MCHNLVNPGYEVLKVSPSRTYRLTSALISFMQPYVCESPLCTYQYYVFNRGPSLEVSLAPILWIKVG